MATRALGLLLLVVALLLLAMVLRRSKPKMERGKVVPSC
jgi:hypothetical protein